MITAKNYSAQAERGLLEFCHSGIVVKKEEIECVEMFQKLISISKHFVIPDDGNLLNDGLKGLKDLKLRLPFEFITVEFFNSGTWTNGQPQKVVIIAHETKEGILIFATLKVKESNYWEPVPVGVLLPYDINCGDNKLCRIADMKIIIPTLYALDTQEYWESIILSFELCVEELIEALSCRNVSTDTYQEGSKKNQKRILNGKIPFYETKMLVIKVNNRISQQTSGENTHQSPRQHLRRGHIRRIPVGNIWVNSCVVGDSTRGKISKSYTII